MPDSYKYLEDFRVELILSFEKLCKDNDLTVEDALFYNSDKMSGLIDTMLDTQLLNIEKDANRNDIDVRLQKAFLEHIKELGQENKSVGLSLMLVNGALFRMDRRRAEEIEAVPPGEEIMFVIDTIYKREKNSEGLAYLEGFRNDVKNLGIFPTFQQVREAAINGLRMEINEAAANPNVLKQAEAIEEIMKRLDQMMKKKLNIAEDTMLSGSYIEARRADTIMDKNELNEIIAMAENALSKISPSRALEIGIINLEDFQKFMKDNDPLEMDSEPRNQKYSLPLNKAAKVRIL